MVMVLLLHNQVAVAQVDTVETSTDTVSHSPKKAAIYSAVLPGLGQVYNKKYWKLPIVYGLMGTTTYLALTNRASYLDYKQAYIYRTDDDPLTVDNFPSLNENQLQVKRNSFRRDMEFYFILTAAVYALNIVDASVDAHLFDFDISSDLSMNLSPAMQPTTFAMRNLGYHPSMKLSFNLH